MNPSSPALSPRDSLRCRLRRRHVAATPEELIRQRLLYLMVEEKGYPPSLLAVEVSLYHLLGGDKKKLPFRRIDIVCYTPAADGGLKPLLLVECKALIVSEGTLRQAASYNYYLAAPFLTLASGTTLYTGSYDASLHRYHFSPGLPNYSILKQQL